MNRTGIEWTNWTWNPITGCLHGCLYCYARKMAMRLRGRCGYRDEDPFQPTFHKNRLQEPSQVKKPAKIFTVSMGDMFGSWVQYGWVCEIFEQMKKNPHHTFQALTKAPQNINKVLHIFTLPLNLWIGTSISDSGGQWRMAHIKAIKGARVRWVSFEPLLGPLFPLNLDDLEWVVIGAETGNRKGRIEPREEWILEIVEAANRSGIPVFMKDNLKPYWTGEWRREFPEGVGVLE